ncbi:MAG: hypothetical protein AB7S99_20050 [Pseudodonghicola sp.]
MIVTNISDGAWQLRKKVEQFLAENGPCAALPTTGPKKDLESRVVALRRWTNAKLLQASRLRQLKDGRFPLWVYLASDCPAHSHLHGVALLSDHVFWDSYFPPNGWFCNCRVAGARSAAGVRRLGGDPEKVLPEGWDIPLPETGLPRGIEEGFCGQTVPGMAARLEALRLHFRNEVEEI